VDQIANLIHIFEGENMPHQLVTQLRFARSEFVRSLEGVTGEEARRRFLPMNCISWIIGHLAAQEQYYFLYFTQEEVPYPNLNKLTGFGRPASTPPLDEMWAAWREITKAADVYLDTLTTEQLTQKLTRDINSEREALKNALFGSYSEEIIDKLLDRGCVRAGETVGTKLLRTTYHYWFHTGEASAIRQLLGHTDLPYFVGDMSAAVYEPHG
jgi:hypothetical protein